MMMRLATIWTMTGCAIILALACDLYRRLLHGIRYEAGLTKRIPRIKGRTLSKIGVFLWCVAGVGLAIVSLFAIWEQIWRLV